MGVSPTPRTTHPARPPRAARITRLERREHGPEGHQSANAGGGWRAGCRIGSRWTAQAPGDPPAPWERRTPRLTPTCSSNMSLILRRLQTSPSLSRTHLARETGLSKATSCDDGLDT